MISFYSAWKFLVYSNKQGVPLFLVNFLFFRFCFLICFRSPQSLGNLVIFFLKNLKNWRLTCLNRALFGYIVKILVFIFLLYVFVYVCICLSVCTFCYIVHILDFFLNKNIYIFFVCICVCLSVYALVFPLVWSEESTGIGSHLSPCYCRNWIQVISLMARPLPTEPSALLAFH